MKVQHVTEVQQYQRTIEVFLFMKATSISLSLKKAEAPFTRKDHIATKKKTDRELKSENGTADCKRKWLQFSMVHIIQS